MAPGMYFDEGLSAPFDHALTVATTILKPTSRGSVTLRSGRPDAKPRIHHNYLATDEDRATLIASLRLAMHLFAHPNLSKVRRGLLGSGIRQGGRHRGFYRATNRHELSSDVYLCHRPRRRLGSPRFRYGRIACRRCLGDAFDRARHTNAAVIGIAEKAADILLGTNPPRRPDQTRVLPA
jgi:hypothetical protein